MKIIFLRHGEAEHNLPSWQGGTNNQNAELTENGRQAALKAADELKQFQFIVAYASPMLRTQQTARLVLEKQENPPKLQTDSRLTDIYVTNKLNKHWHRWENLWRLRLGFHTPSRREEFLAGQKLPEGQSLGESMTPIAEFLADLRQQHKEGVVLVVAHLHTFWGLNRSAGNRPLTSILKADSFISPAEWRELGA